MRKIIITILSAFLFAFTNNQPKEINTYFQVTVDYCGLPNPIHTKMVINNQKIKAFNYHKQTIYDSTSLQIDTLFLRKLYSFLKFTDWENIPAKMENVAFDGYIYRIDLEINNKKYHYTVSNYYQPKMDSLINLCNSAITRKKLRKQYYFYYPNK